jgi:hypothetical protein
MPTPTTTKEMAFSLQLASVKPPPTLRRPSITSFGHLSLGVNPLS